MKLSPPSSLYLRRFCLNESPAHRANMADLDGDKVDDPRDSVAFTQVEFLVSEAEPSIDLAIARRGPATRIVVPDVRRGVVRTRGKAIADRVSRGF